MADLECPFCGAIVDEPCSALDEWYLCHIGENETSADRVQLFLAELDIQQELIP